MRPGKIKLLLLVALLTLSLTASGCAGKTTGTASTDLKSTEKPKVESAEVVADKIMKQSTFQQWPQLYAYLHPDVQAKYTKDQYVTERQQNGVLFSTIKDYKIAKAEKLDQWTDKDGTGKTYTDVAEVPITINFSGDTTLNITMHLAKAPDGTWRYFWSPSTK